jgi:hypothetical protein
LNEGFRSLEEIAFVPLTEMKTVQGLDWDAYLVHRQRAKDFLMPPAVGK